MITKNRVIAERLLREFIRGTFGIISEASPEAEYDPTDDENAAAAAIVVDKNKKVHLEAAQAFVNDRIDILEQILDKIEGPLAVGGLEQLQSVLKDAMNLDDTYKQEDQKNYNLATTFTCLSLAEGNVHNIPYLMAAFYKIFTKKTITRASSGTGRYTLLGQAKSMINEAGRSPVAKSAAEIIDKEIEKIIPLLFDDQVKIAKNIVNNKERFDFEVPSFAKPKFSNATLSPGRSKSLSFKDALKSSALETTKIYGIALGKSESHIQAKKVEIEELVQSIDKSNNTLQELEDTDANSGRVYDELVEKIKHMEIQKADKERELEDFKNTSQEMLHVLEQRLDDKEFLLSKIREFANSDLKGWDRTAANYPKISGAIAAARPYIGKKMIGSALAALAYGVNEVTPASIMKMDFEYESAQDEAVEYIAQMFEDNDMGNFANILRSYKS